MITFILNLFMLWASGVALGVGVWMGWHVLDDLYRKGEKRG